MNEIYLYNTMSKSKEEFKPIKAGEVGIYVCGVTVYDNTHIGHARSGVAFDVIRRYFLYRGYNVTFVKNFTDIDDKIIRRSNEEKVEWKALTEKYIASHNEDMDSLYILPPTHTPKATDYIEGMLDMCERLLDNGNAYLKNGDIYFRVSSFKEYGKLSKRELDDMMAGARVEVNDNKENPLDFALWKASKPGEPAWQHKWKGTDSVTEGRPGWHIECSVMSSDILGETFDIHGGGMDLVFPHHENEIAQSEACSHKTFANYWLHNGFVNINKEKMSKSLGNFFTTKDVLKMCHPEVLRLLFLMTHYRQGLEYATDKFQEVRSALNRIYFYLDDLDNALVVKKSKPALEEVKALKEKFDEEFNSAMSDDFNTPKALAALFEAVHSANTVLANKPDEESLKSLREASDEIFKTVNSVLGIINFSYMDWYLDNLQIAQSEVEAAIESRNIARQNKDYSQADAIRKNLLEKNIELVDTPTGTRFRVI